MHATSLRTDSAPPGPPAPEGAGPALPPTERVLLGALLRLRWAGLALALATVGYDHSELQRPAIAAIALLVIVAGTAAAAIATARVPLLLVHPVVVTVEVVAGAAVMLADGWAFGPTHQSGITAFGGIWVLASVATAGLAWGSVIGALTGAAVALFGLLGGLAPDLDTSRIVLVEPPGSAVLVPTAAVVVLYALAGAGTSYVSRLLGDAEDEIAERRARQRLGAALHDGVLQALAYIARRAADPDIARVARDADIELRAQLHGPAHDDSSDLRAAILTAARRAEHQLRCPLRLAVDDELPDRPAEIIAAVTGAVTEAVTNAAKHAAAGHVTLYAAPAEAGGIEVSVIDDGVGFDASRVPAGGGLDQSLRARLRNIDGTATITSRPGAGTEVALWIP